jgi:uncharacterized protein (TIGR00297 family)
LPELNETLSRLVAAFLVNGAVAAAAYALRTVSPSGAAMGFLLGSTVYAGAGPGAFALLLLFFSVGSAATKVGYRKKQAAGIAQEEGGARGWRHALANAGVPALLALGAAFAPRRDLFLLGLAGALATATGDTVSSEVGKAFGRRTFLLTSFRAVPAGTVGAVSLEGTLAGAAGVALASGAAAFFGLIAARAIAWVGLASFLAFMLEGYLGALLETRGWLSNEQVNFANTLMGAGLAVALVSFFT